MFLPFKTNYRILTVIAIFLVIGLGCSFQRAATPVTDGPTVAVDDPLPGQSAPVGEPLLIDSTSTDADGVERVELWVDDTLYRVDSNPDVSSPYIVSQPWQSDTPGSHVIVVRAFDGQGAEGQSQPITISLRSAAELALAARASLAPSPTTPAPSQEPTETPTPAPTSTPAAAKPTNRPVVSCTPPPCSADEVYYCPDACPGGCGTQCATPTPTALPPSFEPTGIETHEVFEPIWEQPGVKDYLGYAIEAAVDDQPYARQFFERGYLYWWNQPDDLGLIWAVEIDQPTARHGFNWSGPYEDTWDGGDPYSCDAARANPDGPIRGFGKFWCDNPNIAEAIGSARGSESGTGDRNSYGVVQFYQGGVMLYSPLDREVWVLFNTGTWQRHAR
jgi:hypothetical protein